MDEMEMNVEDLKESVDEVAEEMDEGIDVEEEMSGASEPEEDNQWKEEIKVAGEELLSTVKKLINEANVRRVTLKNSDGKTLFEIPLIFGVAGIALLPTLAAVGLVGALLTDCTITVIREEKQPAEAEVEEPEVA